MFIRCSLVVVLIVALLSITPLRAQKLEPYGLEGMTVTSLAISPQHGIPDGILLVAGTDGQGVFMRSVSSSDSTWKMTGLEGKKVTAVHVYHWGVGPADFNTPFAAVKLDIPDTTLLYRYAEEGKWVPADSGIVKSDVYIVNDMASISTTGHEPRGPIFATDSWHTFRSKDMGLSWQRLSFEMIRTLVLQTYQPSWELWAGGSLGRDDQIPWVARSVDQGDTWVLMDDLGVGYNTVFSLAVHPQSSNVVYAGLHDAVIKTVDGGKNWSQTSLRDIPVDFLVLSIDSTDPEHIWAGGHVRSSDSFALNESFDGGGKWQEVEVSAIASISDMVADPAQRGVLYIGTLGDGVWRYENSEPPMPDYFPMQIGNEWSFSGALKESITGTVSVDENLYYQFSSFRDFRDILLRMTEDSELFLRYGDEEQMWLNFGAAVADTWTVHDPVIDVKWLVHLESTEDTVKVPAGIFTDCYRFWFDFGCCDNDWVEWYAPGIGPVKRMLYGIAAFDYSLLHAGINGVSIPDRKGDVDGNGSVDIRDVVFAVNILLNLSEPSPHQFQMADYNGDGVLNILDIVGIVRYILENPSNTSQVPFKDVEDYEHFFVQERGPAVFTSEAQWMHSWELYWNLYDGHGNKIPPPEIDFADQMVLGVFWGGECRFSGCTNKSPSIESVWIENDTLKVQVGPMRDLGPCDMCVSPLHMVQIERFDLPVRFVGDVP